MRQMESFKRIINFNKGIVTKLIIKNFKKQDINLMNKKKIDF